MSRTNGARVRQKLGVRNINAKGENPMVRPSVVMLIDEDDDHAILTMHTLRSHEHVDEVLWFSDGESALDYLRSDFRTSDLSFPDLIFLDLKLPGMSGSDVLEEIRGIGETMETPVIMMTVPGSGYKTSAATRGMKADGFIVKPLDSGNFATALADLNSVPQAASHKSDRE